MKKGFAPIVLVIGILAATLIAYTIYNTSTSKNKTQSENPEQQQKTKEFQGAANSFQETLANKCVNTLINLEELPVTVDISKVNIETTTIENDKVVTVKNKFSCWGTSPGHYFANSRYLQIYDEESEDLAHGGKPYFGFAGQEIENDNSVRFGVYISYGDGGPMSPETLPAVLRAERKIQLKNNETVFASTAVIPMEGGTPKLVNFLKKYSVLDTEYGTNKLIVDLSNYSREEIEKAFILQFFSNPTALDSSEKERVAEVKNRLNAVQAK